MFEVGKKHYGTKKKPQSIKKIIPSNTNTHAHSHVKLF